MTQQRASLIRLFGGLDNLPSMPAAALKIVHLAEDEDSTVDDLAHVIELDPVLAAKILKLANSPLFSSGSDVVSLPRACLMLGFQAVRLTALSFSLIDSVRSGERRPYFDCSQLWRRGAVCAVAARVAAGRVNKLLQEQAFLAGLLSRIGQLAAVKSGSAAYAEVLAAADGWPTAAQERAVLGWSSEQVSAELMRSWNLPASLCDAVERMRTIGAPPSEDPEARDLARCARAGAGWEEILCGGDQGAGLVALREAGFEDELEPQTMDSAAARIAAAAAQAAAALDLKIGEPVEASELVQQARALLYQESLSALALAKQAEQRAVTLESDNRTLDSLAHTDKLTGLANRAAFDEALSERMSAASASERQPVGLLMIDIDRFKSFNDEYGHRAGDAVLEAFGAALRSEVRRGDLAARYGGEEFCVLLRRCSPRELRNVAERIRLAIERLEVRRGEQVLRATASLGGACLIPSGRSDDGARLIEAADRELYRAKSAGRNRAFVPDGVLREDDVRAVTES